MPDRIRDQVRADAQATLKAAPARLLQLRREYDTALDAARAYTNPDMTPEGVQKQREQLVARAHADYQPRFAGIRAQVDTARATIATWAEQARPRLGDTAADLQRAQAGWDRVRSRLDAGMSMAQALEHATVDELLGAREWAPTYVQNQDYAEHSKSRDPLPFTPRDQTQLLHSIDARLGQVAGGDAAKAMAALRDAETTAAEVTPWLQHAAAAVAGGPASDGLAAAMQSRVDASHARAAFATDDGAGADTAHADQAVS